MRKSREVRLTLLAAVAVSMTGCRDPAAASIRMGTFSPTATARLSTVIRSAITTSTAVGAAATSATQSSAPAPRRAAPDSDADRRQQRRRGRRRVDASAHRHSARPLAVARRKDRAHLSHAAQRLALLGRDRLLGVLIPRDRSPLEAATAEIQRLALSAGDVILNQNRLSRMGHPRRGSRRNSRRMEQRTARAFTAASILRMTATRSNCSNTTRTRQRGLLKLRLRSGTGCRIVSPPATSSTASTRNSSPNGKT